jgi:hypothetical protein
VRNRTRLVVRLGTLGIHVLCVVRLINHQQAEVHFRGLGQCAQRVVGGDRDAAVADPRLEVPLAVRAVQPVGPQLTVPPDLVSPVDQDARRAHDEEVRSAFGMEMAHRSQGLDALAQAHLIAEYRPLLAQRKLRAERLVPAQGRAHEGEVERVLMDPLRDVCRDEALPGLDVGRELADLDEQPVVVDGTLLVVLPQAGGVGRSRGELFEALLELGIQARLVHHCHQVAQLAQGAPGLVALAGAGEEHPQSARRAPRSGEDRIERGCHVIEVLGTRRGCLACYPIGVEFS